MGGDAKRRKIYGSIWKRKVMEKDIIKLYCCCLADKHPRYNLKNGILAPVLAGAANCDEKTRHDLISQGWLVDDSGDNISKLNEIWGDLTMLYWVWKNTKDNMVGVCQYRRTWCDDELAQIQEDILYVPHPMTFTAEGSVRNQYNMHHNLFPAYEFSLELAQQNKIPLSVEMLEYSWNQQKFYACNMAYGSRAIFNRFAEIVFAIMVPFFQEHNELCNGVRGAQRRTIAFTAERMITAILLHSRYFFGANFVKETTMTLVE